MNYLGLDSEPLPLWWTSDFINSSPPGTASKQEKKPKFVMGYWDIRGLAAPLRMMFEYSRAQYVDKQYSLKGSAPNFDPSDWFKGDKVDLIDSNAMINLP